MATRGKKISEQTLTASLDGNEIIPFAKNGADGAVKASKIKEWIEPDLSKLDSLPTATELDAALTAKQDKLVNSADVTVGEDDKLTVADTAKRKVFDDLWISAAGADGSNGTVDHTHTESGVSKPYYLNEVWMTYEEALVVYNEKFTRVDALIDRGINGVTNFVPNPNGLALSFSSFSANNTKVINVGYRRAKQLVSWLNNAQAVTKILGVIDLYYWDTSLASYHYLNCPLLTTINLKNLRYDFNIGNLKRISLSSMQYMVNNSSATSSITVTVHPDVYAKLTGDTTNAAAAALTSDELAQWTALVTTANSKNISFATPG